MVKNWRQVILGLLSFFLNVLLGGSMLAQDTTYRVQVDSIIIVKNWRTRSEVIKREFQIRPGELLSIAQIDSGVRRVRNIGNFVDVKYQLDTLDTGVKILKLTAKDRLTVSPGISITGNKTDYKMSFSLSDDNFLGWNIGVSTSIVFKNTGNQWGVSVRIPRQILPKNTTIRAGATVGEEFAFRLKNSEVIDWYAFDKVEAYVEFGNPNNKDLTYSFSPDLTIQYRNHRTNNSLLPEGYNAEGALPAYDIHSYELSVRESMGLINHNLHRKDGKLLSVKVNLSLLEDEGYTAYPSFETQLQYHKIVNSWLQFSGTFNTGYTTSNYASLQFRISPHHFLGIQSGEVYGKAFYYMYAGAYITWVNTHWLSLEQAFYYNFGNGGMSYTNLAQERPLSAIGTSIMFNVPMVSFLSGKVSVSYSLGNSRGFDVNY